VAIAVVTAVVTAVAEAGAEETVVVTAGAEAGAEATAVAGQTRGKILLARGPRRESGGWRHKKRRPRSDWITGRQEWEMVSEGHAAGGGNVCALVS
jgi:hypothetical protein